MDESQIPIDINTIKLLEWLQSRRHVTHDWQANICNIRAKINAAIQDMPAHDGIVQLLSGQHINYFHCVEIVEILRETEADTKNLFGGYGSRRMKDWQEIIACYQQSNIYLAEAAQLLIRNVNYEIPGLRKQIAKCEQVQQDGEKRIKEFMRTETIAANEFATCCKQLGIRGDQIKSELIELLKELPAIYKRIDFTFLQPAIDMYTSFIHFHAGNKDTILVLAILQYLVTNGNVTTYEYTYGEKPVSIEEEHNLDQHNLETGNIDFGDNVQIDFSVNDGDIDWGATPSTTPEEEFEIVEMDINLEESGIVVEKCGLDGGVAKGNDAFTLLDNPKTREQIINDLIELNAFLKMRLYEMASSSDMMMMNMDAPMQTIEGVTSLADHVTIALDALTNKRILHLHNIKHSPKYVDMLSAALTQKRAVIERMKANKTAIEQKIVEQANEIQKITPIIKQMSEKTKILQKHIENDISQKYKGRTVHIVGAVNQL